MSAFFQNNSELFVCNCNTFYSVFTFIYSFIHNHLKLSYFLPLQCLFNLRLRRLFLIGNKYLIIEISTTNKAQGKYMLSLLF